MALSSAGKELDTRVVYGWEISFGGALEVSHVRRRVCYLSDLGQVVLPL